MLYRGFLGALILSAALAGCAHQPPPTVVASVAPSPPSLTPSDATRVEVFADESEWELSGNVAVCGQTAIVIRVVSPRSPSGSIVLPGSRLIRACTMGEFAQAFLMALKEARANETLALIKEQPYGLCHKGSEDDAERYIEALGSMLLGDGPLTIKFGDCRPSWADKIARKQSYISPGEAHRPPYFFFT